MTRKATPPPIFTKEVLLLLALSCATHTDGLSIEEAIRALAERHNLTLPISQARAAARILLARNHAANGIKKVPPGRTATAEYYRLTDTGRAELDRVVGILRAVVARAPVRTE